MFWWLVIDRFKKMAPGARGAQSRGLDVMKQGIVSREMYEIQAAFLDNPTGWHKDKKMWKRFLDWKKRWKKTGKL